MTCIVGIIENGRVHLGADSCGSTDWTKVNRVDQKVFTIGEFVFGFTTSYRMGQLLRYSFKPPEFAEGKGVFAYMVTDFIDAVRACLKAGGYAKASDGVESGGEFLVGVRGRLFKIEGDYQVGESADSYTACGCGEAYALGSLYTTGAIYDVSHRLQFALEAAAHHSAGVAPPFVFVSTP